MIPTIRKLKKKKILTRWSYHYDWPYFTFFTQMKIQNMENISVANCTNKILLSKIDEGNKNSYQLKYHSYRCIAKSDVANLRQVSSPEEND